LKLFVIIGNDRGSRQESNVTFSGSHFFVEGGAGPVTGTVGIEPMSICGIKDIEAAAIPPGGAEEFERW
jgi:hypothetical protein